MPDTSEAPRCRGCQEVVGEGTGFAMCEDVRRCYAVNGSSEGCHRHFRCARCSDARGRMRRIETPVQHCVNDREMCESCESCTDTCNCMRCTGCGDNMGAGEYCTDCEQCRSCCACNGCAECGGSARSLCSDCDRCETCCVCASSDEVPRFTQPELCFHSAGRKEHTENPSKRYISVELEVCGIKDHGGEVGAAVRKWKGAIVNDGSLPGGGFEINTAPASGDKFTTQIDEICAALAKADAWVDTEAGMHVHVDARDFSYYDMRKLVKLYAHTEEQLYRTCKIHRRDTDGPGRYCAPCGATYVRSLRTALVPKASKAALLSNVYGGKPGREFKDTKRNKYESVRYHALNLHSWIHRGTVECRMYHGTVKARGAKTWGMLWAGILDFAYKHGEAEIDLLVRTKSPHDLLMMCAPTDAVRNWLQNRWNVLHLEHAQFERREWERRERERSDREESMAYARDSHERTMRTIERNYNITGESTRPPWAFDYERTPNGPVPYAWLGPDDIYLRTFGIHNTGTAARNAA